MPTLDLPHDFSMKFDDALYLQNYALRSWGPLDEDSERLALYCLLTMPMEMLEQIACAAATDLSAEEAAAVLVGGDDAHDR